VDWRSGGRCWVLARWHGDEGCARDVLRDQRGQGPPTTQLRLLRTLVRQESGGINGIEVNRQFQIRLPAGPPTLRGRIKAIALGITAAIVISALLFAALILGSIIAVVIGIAAVIAIAFVVIRASLRRASLRRRKGTVEIVQRF